MRFYFMRVFFGVGLLIAAGAVYCPGRASAEISNCNGKWTNLPCPAGNVRGTMPEMPAQPRDFAAEEQDTKQTALHKLRMDAAAAASRYRVRQDLTSAEYLCGKNEVSVETCLDKIDELRKTLDERVARAEGERKQAEQAKKNELAGKEHADEPTQGNTETNVVIVNDNRDGFRHLRHDGRRWGVRPALPGSYASQGMGGAASVTVHGSGGGASFSGTAGGYSHEGSTTLQESYIPSGPIVVDPHHAAPGAGSGAANSPRRAPVRTSSEKAAPSLETSERH
jgi:hypothetical protein